MLKEIDEAFLSVGLEQESQVMTRDQLTMSMFKLGFIRCTNKEESVAINKLCNVIENPITRAISFRDFKIMILAICCFQFEWMFCSQPNLKKEQKHFKQFGYFYEGKYYLNNKEECNAINQHFLILFNNRRIMDKNLKQVFQVAKKSTRIRRAVN
mmetsp:Transcript_17861/g.17082  ORF Transcript_17861/g.17082 Transcript_17861/m.17082 type:complete len:155 (+) Transcript_17861:225-689(+)